MGDIILSRRYDDIILLYNYVCVSLILLFWVVVLLEVLDRSTSTDGRGDE